MSVAGLSVGSATFEAVFPVRRAVLRPTLPPAESRYAGDDHPAVAYVAGWLDGHIVSVATVFPEPCPWRTGAVDADRHWRLRGMATLDGHKGRGVGAAVLRAAIDRAVAGGAALMWFEAREDAVPFYLRHGFRPEGEPWTLPVTGVQRHMWAELP
ncbi:MAG: GNAT family N-acetyltransferase [Rhodospirillales bacterium]|jgi:GNAT superfamily N-acetyltransferase